MNALTDTISSAADALQQEGQEPSITLLKERLNASFSDIASGFWQWQETKVSDEIKNFKLSDDLRKQLEKFAKADSPLGAGLSIFSSQYFRLEKALELRLESERQQKQEALAEIKRLESIKVGDALKQREAQQSKEIEFKSLGFGDYSEPEAIKSNAGLEALLRSQFERQSEQLEKIIDILDSKKL